MSEPTSAVGTFAGYKLALFSLPIIASLIAFWLGLRFVPLRGTDPRGDLLNRVLACFVSSFLLGIPALVLLMQHWPVHLRLACVWRKWRHCLPLPDSSL
jgi:hypothetical protein